MRILLYGSSGMLGEAIIEAADTAGYLVFEGAHVPPERLLTGSRARKLRTLAGMPLQALANASGVNKAYLSEFENGLRSLREPELAATARALAAKQPPGRFVHDAVWDDSLILRDINDAEPDVIINAAGVIPERRVTDAGMIYMNAVLPHIIAERATDAGVPMIHVSTDCVNEPTVYGRSKLAGETEYAVNVRTSFVGPRHGLWKWLEKISYSDNTGGMPPTPGWVNAMWSGSTVDAVARALIDLAQNPGDSRTLNLAMRKPIRKYDLLELLIDEHNWSANLYVVEEPRIDRSMRPDIELPSFADALAERHA